MPSHEVTEQLFDSVFNLDFKGPFRLAAQVGKRMYDGDGGAIINVSSTGAVMTLPQIVPYGASKAALNAMSLSLAQEYAPKVRVNTLSAGPFLTDIAKAWAPDAREHSNNALGHPGRPWEVRHRRVVPRLAEIELRRRRCCASMAGRGSPRGDSAGRTD